MYKSEVRGKGGIVARVVAHSKHPRTGKEVVTFEVEHHRWILAEVNKHRMLSNNYQSSRAVPIERVLETIEDSPAMPIHWGAKQAGMQASKEVENWDAFGQGEYQWLGAANAARARAEIMNDQGYHKQIVNRLLEPFSMTKGVITGTEWDNFFYLRRHQDAQPEFQELANCMWEALQQSEPDILVEGEWHVPYVYKVKDHFDNVIYLKTPHEVINDGKTYVLDGLTEKEALQRSAAACAQVSYRKLDLSDDVVERVWSRLVDTEQPHSVCLEHQVRPLSDPTGLSNYWEVGVTHEVRNGSRCSGNVQHFVQHRHLLPNNTCWDYKP